jgi:hypothetical protein
VRDRLEHLQRGDHARLPQLAMRAHRQAEKQIAGAGGQDRRRKPAG